MDFMMYAMGPIINEAANWHYMNGGRSSAPVVIWGIINRGGEQAAQHSQAIHALFAHVPGLKVVMPSTPHDAKGLMIAAIMDDNPVVYVDDRWLYGIEGDVPEEIYEVPIGKAAVRREGGDVTVAATSYMVKLAIEAANELEKECVDVEVLDLRTIKPLVSCQSSSVGYSLASFILASSVVNCQLTLAPLLFLDSCQADDSLLTTSMSSILRFRH